MKNLTRNQKIIYSALGLFLLLLIALIIINRPQKNYSLTAEESISLLTDKSQQISVEEARSNNPAYAWVYVGNNTFVQPLTITEAARVPLHDILKNSTLNLLEEMNRNGQTVVLYGDTPQQASSPWFLLKQTGVDNIKYFAGDVTKLYANLSDSLIKAPSVLVETPLTDTTFLAEQRNKATQLAKSPPPPPAPKPAAKKVVPKKVEVPESSGGGC